MQLSTYSNIRDSNVPWIQSVPSHWTQKRLKFVVELVNQKQSVDQSDLPYIGLEHIESWTGRKIDGEISQSEGLASTYASGDVLFGKLRPYLAKIHMTDTPGLVSSEALVIRPSSDISSSFLKYYFLSRDFINTVDSSTYGSKMPRASWDYIGNLPLLIPSAQEQQAIVGFLDQKTSQIDALIAKKQALLEKLDEQRTALISQAVTKGLDPSVPMKDSGVEWLGDIPEGWSTCLLKRLSDISYGIGGEIDRSKSDGIKLISLPNVTKSGELNTDDTPYCDIEPDEKNKILLKKGDLLFNWRNGSSEHLGKTALFNLDGEWAHVSFLLKIRFDLEKCDSRYFNYLLSGYRYTGFFTSSKAGVNNTFNLAELSNLWVVVPPKPIQCQISDVLDKKLASLSSKTKKILDILNRLFEYRSTLITNAVTGKIDVRDFFPNTTTEQKELAHG